MLAKDLGGLPPDRRRSRLAVAVLVLFGLLSLAAPGSTDPFGVGGKDTGWLADNHDHDYCWSYGFTWRSLRNLADDAMDYLESATDFADGSRQSCNSGTDIYFQRYNTTSYRGRYVCFDRIGNVCDRANVKISSNTRTLPLAERAKTICHEIGHSGGATHHDRGYGCMKSGASTSEIYWFHTRNHMNDLEVATS